MRMVFSILFQKLSQAITHHRNPIMIEMTIIIELFTCLLFNGTNIKTYFNNP